MLFIQPVSAQLMDSIYPMFGVNLQRTGISEYYSNINGTIEWTYDTIDFVDGFLIDNTGVLYANSYNSKIHTIYPNGTQKWNFTLNDYAQLSGLSSDGILYFSSYDDNFYAIYPNGTQKWNYTTGANNQEGIIGSDGTIYFGSYDYNLYALYPNGTLKWKYLTDNWIGTAPTISSDGTIYIAAANDKLYAIYPNGTLKWSSYGTFNINSKSVIASDGCIYFSTSDGILYATNPNGTTKWMYDSEGSIHSNPSINNDGIIYLNQGNNLHAINPNGTLKWIHNFNGWTGRTIIDSMGLIHVTTEDDKGLHILYSNGTIKNSYFIDDYPVTVVISSDGTIYLGTYTDSAGKLYAFESFNPPQYPSDVNFSVDGSQIYYNAGDLNTTELMPSFVSEINTYLSTCVESVPGYCDIPLTFETSDAGNLLVDGLSINYNDGGINFRATIMNTGFKDTVLKRIQATTTDGTVCEFTPPYTNFEVGDFLTVSNITCPITCNNFLSFKATTTCATSDEFTGVPNGC